MHLTTKIAVPALLISILTSCSTVYQYGPGNLGHESRLLLTPGNKDSIRTSQNLSGRYSFNLGKGYSPGESCRFGELYYHLGYSAKYFSGAIGCGLFGGVYDVQKFTQDQGLKNFYGLNGLGQMAINLPIGPFNWRILGLRAGFTAESGSLYDFRIKYRNYPNFNEFSGSRLIGFTGTSSELMYSKGDYRLGVSGSTVFLIGKEKFLGMASSSSFFAGYQNFSLVYQFTSSFRQGQNQSLGLVWRLK